MRVYVNAVGVEAVAVVWWPSEVVEACDVLEGVDDGDHGLDPARVWRRAEAEADGPEAEADGPEAEGKGPRAVLSPGGRGARRARPPVSPASAPSSRTAAPLVRVHDACMTSELFGSVKCDCAAQLEESKRLAELHAKEEGSPGCVLYLPQEGRGIGLAAKVAAYRLQSSRGADTVDANRMLGLPDDSRRYDAARDALGHLGFARIRLLTNNPTKRARLTALGVEVEDTVPLLVPVLSDHARRYLRTKQERMGHVLRGEDGALDDDVD